MLAKASSCQEIGDLAVQFLGSLVLLCIANNVIALLCLPPPSFRSKEVHWCQRRRETPEEEAQEEEEAASSPEGGHPRSARSTHRSSSRPEATPRAHRHGSSRVGPDGGGGSGGSGGLSRRGSRRGSGVATAGGKRPEPSSSGGRRGRRHEQAEDAEDGKPSGRRPRTPCPSKILILSAGPKGAGPQGGGGGGGGAGTPRGQVVYDARWLPCVLGEGGQAPLLPQQLRELCSRTPPARRPRGASPAPASKEAVG